MSNILLRAITGFFFIGVIVGALWIGNLIGSIVLTLFAILGLNEFFNLFNNHLKISINKNAALSSSTIIFLMLALIITLKYDLKYLIIIIPIIFLYLLIELYRKKANPIENLGIYALSLIYIVIPFILAIHLNVLSSHQEPLVIGMFLLIWTNDTFAYLSGRFFGKTKLFERISPKKTWEGTIGGIIFTIIVGISISFWTIEYNMSFWVLAALLIAPCSIFGDLLESLFKRSLNIKDSGNILPGHGGILDRFDAAIYAIPFFYTLVIIYS